MNEISQALLYSTFFSVCDKEKETSWMWMWMYGWNSQHWNVWIKWIMKEWQRKFIWVKWIRLERQRGLRNKWQDDIESEV